MRFILISFALIATVAADVSHLNNEYLPPVQSHVGAGGAGGAPSYADQPSAFEYAQQSEEVPKQAEQVPEPSAPSQQFDQSSPQDTSSSVDGGEAGVSGSESQQDFSTSFSGGAPSSSSSSDDLSSDKAGLPDFGSDNSISGDVQGAATAPDSVPESPAAQGPTIRAPEPAQDAVAQYVSSAQDTHADYSGAASSGIDTKYGANGGYVY